MKEINISLKQLRYYLVAARHKSLRQAAVELRITQPSLSAQLKSLEEALEAVLFERNRGGVLLTPLGRDLLVEARSAVNAAEAIIEAANLATRGPGGTYRLGVSPSFGPYILPWILPAVHHQYPEVKFFVREQVPTLLSESLLSGNHDLIFTTLPLEDPAISVMPLFREPVYLVINADHPLADQEMLDPGQLQGLEVLTIEEHYLFRTQIEDLCKRFKARLLRDYEGTSLDAIRQMVYMEMGVAFLPALYIRSEIRDRDELHVLGIDKEHIFRSHALAWRKGSPLRGFYRELGRFFQKVIQKEFGEEVTML
ncbi:MAG: hydrogen peroxide-inducible genes activator [Pseudohongiellaceae bacterium]